MGIKGGLRTRCLVMTPVLSGKLEYSGKLRRYLGRDKKVFGGISAGTEEFFEVSQPGRNSTKTDIFDFLKNNITNVSDLNITL